jgi:zinc protease
MTACRRVASLAACAVLLLARMGSAQNAAWPSQSPPRPLAAHDVKFPPYELRTLQNGMQVVVVMHHEQPAVSLRLIVRAGSAQDPAGEAGLASLAASLLDQGTGTRTAAQLADLLDSVGGDSDTGAGRDLSFARVLVMKDSFDLGLNLLADEIRNPSFADEEIERQRQRMISALKVSYDDPEYIADVVFDRLVYGFNPYGAPSGGTPQSLPRITRADLQAFHRRWYAPNNCLLAVVGDVTAEEAFAAAARAFGDWPKREVPADTPADPPAPARRVLVVDRPEAVQTEVRVGHLGVPRKLGDYTALDLAIRILGGQGANRLHRVLRMERGLTYGASAEMETLKRAGEFVAITNTRSEATGEVLRLVVEQFNRLRNDRVGDEELADAKAYLTGNLPLRIEAPDDIALQVLNVLFYDLPIDELQTYRERVNAVSVGDIARVAGAYLHPDSLSVVLVGNAKAFVPQLKAVGFDKYEVIPATDLDITAVDLRRPAGAADTEPETADSARALLQRAIRAKGGADRLRAVRTIVATGILAVRSPQPVEARTTAYIQYPDKFRVDAALTNGEVTQVLAAGEAWRKDPSGVHDLDAQERDALRSNAARDLVSLLLRAAEGQLDVRLVAGQGDADRPVDTLRLSGGGLAPVDLLVDRSTGMIAAERYIVDQPGAIGKVATEEWYSDYREVDGIQVAFRTVIRRGEAVILERTLTTVHVNVTLDEQTFKRPA